MVEAPLLMNMTLKRLYLGLAVVTICSFPGYSQDQFNTKLEREARWQLYKNIVEMEMSSPVASSSMRDEFFDLFSDSATHIVDFPMWNNSTGEKMSIDEYMTTYQELFRKGRQTEVEIDLIAVDLNRVSEPILASDISTLNMEIDRLESAPPRGDEEESTKRIQTYRRFIDHLIGHLENGWGIGDLLAREKAAFEKKYLSNGTEIFTNSLDFEIGSSVFFKDQKKREEIPLEDNLYELEGGGKIKVFDGKVLEIEGPGNWLDLLNLQSIELSTEVTANTVVRKRFLGVTNSDGWKFESPQFTQNLEITWNCTDLSELISYWASQDRGRSNRVRKPELPFHVTAVEWAESHEDLYVALVDESNITAEIECGGNSLPGPRENLAIYLNENPTWIVRDGAGEVADYTFEAPYFTDIDSTKEVLRPQSLQTAGEKKPWNFTLFGGITQLATGTVSSSMFDSATLQSSVGFGLGASGGYSILRSHEDKLDLFATCAFTSRKLSVGVATLGYSYDEVDPDNFAYERLTAGTNWSEDLSETSVVFGIGTRYLRRVIDNPSGSQWHAGAAIETYVGLVSETHFSNQAEAVFSGFYEDLYGITIDENGIYDFGTFSTTGEGDKSWARAYGFPVRGVLGYKTNELSALSFLLELGPTLHVRNGNALDQPDFLTPDGLNSVVHQSDNVRFVTLDCRMGIRKRIGWASLKCDND